MFNLTLPGVKAKLLKLGAQADSKVPLVWVKGITNHLYWCASSTPDGDGEVIKAKWTSLINHVQNVHEVPKCVHQPINPSEDRKKWLKPSK